MARGKALWRSIYEPHADKLYGKLGSYHPDFIGKWNHFSASTHLRALPSDLDPIDSYFGYELIWYLIRVYHPELRFGLGSNARRRPGAREP